MADFNSTLESPATIEESDAKKQANAAARERKKQNLEKWRQAFDATVAETGEQIKDILSTRSKELRVVNCLTYGDPGMIIRKHDDGTETKEPVVNIVGYLVENIGGAPFEAYTTKCEFVDGAYTKSPVKVAIAPGMKIALRKADFVNLMSAPELSFEAANGKLTTKTYQAGQDIEAYLESHSFRFADDVKIADTILEISTKIDGADVVKPEFKETFGYLENKAEKKQRASKKVATQTAQQLEANFVRRLISGQAV